MFTESATYWYDDEKETLIEEADGKQTALGCGKIVIKTSFKKATKTKVASIAITCELTPDTEKDYEIIPYSPDEDKNEQNIADFMAKYITKPFEYLDKLTGVEINFNKVFYKPEQLRPVKAIVKDLDRLETALKDLESQLSL